MIDCLTMPVIRLPHGMEGYESSHLDDECSDSVSGVALRMEPLLMAWPSTIRSADEIR